MTPFILNVLKRQIHRESKLMVGKEGGAGRGMTVTYRISFMGDKNVLEWIVMIVIPTCDVLKPLNCIL